MKKKSKWPWIIGVVAAVISAVVLVIVFWDKLLEKCSCRKGYIDVDYPDGTDDDVLAYPEEELADFADLNK